MNTEQLRQSAREKWLSYYQENREWITRLGVWVKCNGQHRPSSGFILATLSTLEPQLTQMLPLIVDLSNNPDRIVLALGLNFDPEKELEAIAAGSQKDQSVKFLPAGANQLNLSELDQASRPESRIDESCRGSRSVRD